MAASLLNGKPQKQKPAKRAPVDTYRLYSWRRKIEIVSASWNKPPQHVRKLEPIRDEGLNVCDFQARRTGLG